MKKYLLLMITFIISCLSYVSYADEELISNSAANPEFYQHLTKSAPHNLQSNSNGLVLPKMYMLHVNGVNTNYESAIMNKNNLLVASKLTSSTNYVIWSVVYNPTAGPNPTDPKMPEENLLDNLIDTFAQKNKELYLHNASLEKYVDAYIVANDLQDFFNKQTDPAGYKDLTDHLRSHYLQEMDYIAKAGDNMKYVIDNFHNQVPLQYAGVLKLLSESPAEIRDYSHSPDTVLLIPHSQGNIYANHLYSYLTDVEHFDKKHIAIYGIGSAADQNVGDWPRYEKNNMTPQMTGVLPVPLTSYTTSCDDPVINGLRGYELGHEVFTIFNIFGASVSAPGVAACNVTNTYQFGHNLVNYYLAIDKLREPIVTMINYYAYILNYNQMHDLEKSITAGTDKYKKYPQSIAFIIGYTRLDAHQIVTQNGWPFKPEYGYWDKYYDYKANNLSLLYLNTPLLDGYVDKYPSNALMHFVARPDFYGREYNLYVYESVQEVSTNNGYPIRIYPYSKTSTQSYGFDTAYYNPLYDKNNVCTFDSYKRGALSDPFGLINAGGFNTALASNDIDAKTACYNAMQSTYPMYPDYKNGFWLDGLLWR